MAVGPGVDQSRLTAALVERLKSQLSAATVKSSADLTIQTSSSLCPREATHPQTLNCFQSISLCIY
jgi:hypothetical protein